MSREQCYNIDKVTLNDPTPLLSSQHSPVKKPNFCIKNLKLCDLFLARQHFDNDMKQNGTISINPLEMSYNRF